MTNYCKLKNNKLHSKTELCILLSSLQRVTAINSQTSFSDCYVGKTFIILKLEPFENIFKSYYILTNKNTNFTLHMLSIKNNNSDPTSNFDFIHQVFPRLVNQNHGHGRVMLE